MSKAKAGDGRRAFLASLRPVVELLGASLVLPADVRGGDTPVRWNGEVVAYVRAPELHGALERVVATVEREIESPLADMDRAQKQMAVRRLDEHGAFLMRGAVEDIAAQMGVSKVTLYSYLNAIERAG